MAEATERQKQETKRNGGHVLEYPLRLRGMQIRQDYESKKV